MTARKLRFIQIGTGGFGGFWCKKHLPPVIAEGKAELVAAVDIDPAAHANAVQHLGLEPGRCYTDLRQALREHACDFVNIVVPPYAHEEVVELALEFNCHVLMEKPVAETMEASCRIYHRVKRTDRKMAITVSHSFDQDKQTLEALLRSGRYGALSYLIGRFAANYRSEAGNPRAYAHQHFLVSSAVHQFDTIRALTGSDAKTVHALSWNPPWAPFREHGTALALIEMENGARVFYEGSKSNATHANGWGNDYFRAECEQATIELDRREIRVRSDLGYPHPASASIPLLQRPYWTHTAIIRQFIDWLGGAEAPRCTIDDNMQTTALQFAAIESGLTGRIVDVQPFLQHHLERSRSGG